MKIRILRSASFGLLGVFLSVSSVAGQESNDARQLDDAKKLTVVESTDPRILAFTKQYRDEVHHLSQQLIAEIEKLGTVDPPAYLDTVQENEGKLSFHGSLRGFANHSISIYPRDVKATPPWNHMLDDPPLSCREALVIANHAMNGWFDNEDSRFLLQRLSLVPFSPSVGKWYWEAEYEVSKGGLRKDFTVAIRMDGKILTKAKPEE